VQRMEGVKGGVMGRICMGVKMVKIEGLV